MARRRSKPLFILLILALVGYLVLVRSGVAAQVIGRMRKG